MSRTLAFIAGLTLPAGVYYISTLHIRGTADLISSDLHDKARRLSGAGHGDRRVGFEGDAEGEVLPPSHARAQEGLSANVQRRWNNVIESTHATLTETQWSQYASNAFSKAKEMMPSESEVRHAVQDLREAGIGAEEKVRERVAHNASIVRDNIAHDAQVVREKLAKQSDGFTDRVEQLGDAIRHDTRVAAEEIKHQAHVANEHLKAGTQTVREEARSLGDRLSEGAESARQQARVFGDKLAKQAEAAGKKASELAERTKQNLTPPPNEKTLKETLAEAYERAATEAKQASKEAQIAATDKWRAMLDGVDESLNDRHKRMLEELGPKRVGFVR